MGNGTVGGERMEAAFDLSVLLRLMSAPAGELRRAPWTVDSSERDWRGKEGGGEGEKVTAWGMAGGRWWRSRRRACALDSKGAT